MVAKLKGLGDAEYTVKPEENYAEMWIGTHPSGPSRVVRDGSPGPLLKVSWREGGGEVPPQQLREECSAARGCCFFGHSVVPEVLIGMSGELYCHRESTT